MGISYFTQYYQSLDSFRRRIIGVVGFSLVAIAALFGIQYSLRDDLGAAASVASERYDSIHVAIKVLENGICDVAETIQVTSAGDKIRTGISRALPSVMEAENTGKRTIVPTVKVLVKDDEELPLNVLNNEDGALLRFVDPSGEMPGGAHVFFTAYLLHGVVKISDSGDDFLWTISNGLALPVNSISAEITFPQGIDPQKVSVQWLLRHIEIHGVESDTADKSDGPPKYERQVVTNVAPSINNIDGERKLTTKLTQMPVNYQAVLLKLTWPPGVIVPPLTDAEK